MIELGLAGIAAFWVVCAVLTYGMAMAEWNAGSLRSWRRDAADAVLIACFGPIALFITFLTTGFAERGFQWRRK